MNLTTKLVQKLHMRSKQLDALIPSFGFSNATESRKYKRYCRNTIQEEKLKNKKES